MSPSESPAAPTTRPLAAAAALAVFALSAALFTQHALDMQPCSWCVAQRVAILVAAVFAAVGAALGHGRASRLFAGLTAVTAFSGLAAAVWQQGWASKSLSCALTWADRMIMKSGLGQMLPAVFQPTASCAEANQALLGLPYAAWSAFAFIGIALLSLAALRQPLAVHRQAGATVG